MEIKMNNQEYKIKQFFGRMADIFNKEISQKDKEEFSNSAVVFFQDIQDYEKQELQKHIKDLEKEAIENIKNEIATKDFVRAEIAEAKIELKQEIAEVRQEIAEVRTELKQEIAELRTEVRVGLKETNTKMKYYFFILIFLMFVLQPAIFEKIQMLLGIVK